MQGPTIDGGVGGGGGGGGRKKQKARHKTHFMSSTQILIPAKF